MHEMDLIPHEYYEQRWRKRFLLRMAIVTGLVLILMTTGNTMLDRANRSVSQQISTLKAQDAVTTRQQAELEKLSLYAADLERQLSTLNSLRQGGAAEQMFRIIDTALVPNIWFLKWSFFRAGLVHESTSPEPLPTGYFLMLPEDGTPADGLQLQTQMSITGQAYDHSALSKFVRRLFEQKEVADVRLVKTTQVALSDQDVVGFELTITLRSEISR